eukprot:scaffold6270_cov26-Tisochrysis_lutea.AAC.1
MKPPASRVGRRPMSEELTKVLLRVLPTGEGAPESERLVHTDGVAPPPPREGEEASERLLYSSRRRA